MSTLARLSPVPPADLDRFMAESEACRNWLGPRLRALDRLRACGGKGIGAAIEREARPLGLSSNRLRALYDAYRHSGGDFAAIIDRRQFPEPGARSVLSPAVIELWQRLCEENQRKCKPAYRAFLRLWQRGEPRDLVWPAFDAATDRPAGCTYRNLLRHRPGNFSLAAMRSGLGGALGAHGPMVLTTRVGLWVGSHLMIDDLKRDLKVLLLGHGGKEAVIQELGVFDLYSGHRFAVHRQPQFVRDSDGRKDSLKEREMRWLLAATFRNVGYSRRGTEIPAEKGTAAVRGPFAKWLHEQSNGLITVRDPGILGKAQALLGWRGRGGGNPRHKAPLESHHNLVHNEAANLPAQTGHDRTPPEWLHGIERDTQAVIELLRTLPAERAAALRVGMLEYWQACAILDEIDHRVSCRTEHDLEGWIECGHVRVEHCTNFLTDEWIGPEEFLALPQAAQDRLALAAERLPEMRRARKLSPREVFASGAGDLVRLSDCQLALFFTDRELGDDLRRPVRLSASGMFEIQDKDAAPEPLFFQREIAARDGGSLRLEERTEYRAVLNPFDPAALWLFDERGSFLGTAPQIARASRLEDRAHELDAQLGRVSHEKAALLAPLRERHKDAEALIAEIREHNEAVAAGVTAEEQAAQRERERGQKRASRFGAALREAMPPAEADETAAPAETWPDHFPTDETHTPTTPTPVETW